MEHSCNQGKSCSQGNAEQTLPSLCCGQQTQLRRVLSQAFLPQPPRPEPAALPSSGGGFPPAKALRLRSPQPLRGSRHGARQQPLGTARRHLPGSSVQLGDRARRVVPCRDRGTRRCPKSRRITPAALLRGSPGARLHPITPRRRGPQLRLQCCRALEDTSRESARVKTIAQFPNQQQGISDARLGAR